MGGSGRDMAFAHAMAEGQASRQFAAAFHQAMENFHQDAFSTFSFGDNPVLQALLVWASNPGFNSCIDGICFRAITGYEPTSLNTDSQRSATPAPR